MTKESGSNERGIPFRRPVAVEARVKSIGVYGYQI